VHYSTTWMNTASTLSGMPPSSAGSNQSWWVNLGGDNEILYGLRDRYEQHHKLKISDEASSPPRNSERYISDRYLPDKAIDLVDEAGSRVRLMNSVVPPAAKELAAELRQVQRQRRRRPLAGV